MILQVLRLIAFLTLALSLAGCGAEDEIITPIITQTSVEAVESANDDGIVAVTQMDRLYFIHDNLHINMNDNMIDVLAQTGEPLHMFESPSCAFEGIDRIFYFDGFIVDTFPVGDEDFVLALVFRDDTVATQNGIKLGATYADMVLAYGDGYDNMLNLFSYTIDGVRLSFLFEGDEIVDITYYNLAALI